MVHGYNLQETVKQPQAMKPRSRPQTHPVNASGVDSTEEAAIQVNSTDAIINATLAMIMAGLLCAGGVPVGMPQRLQSVEYLELSTPDGKF